MFISFLENEKEILKISLFETKWYCLTIPLIISIWYVYEQIMSRQDKIKYIYENIYLKERFFRSFSLDLSLLSKFLSDRLFKKFMLKRRYDFYDYYDFIREYIDKEELINKAFLIDLKDESYYEFIKDLIKIEEHKEIIKKQDIPCLAIYSGKIEMYISLLVNKYVNVEKIGNIEIVSIELYNRINLNKVKEITSISDLELSKLGITRIKDLTKFENYSDLIDLILKYKGIKLNE